MGIEEDFYLIADAIHATCNKDLIEALERLSNYFHDYESKLNELSHDNSSLKNAILLTADDQERRQSLMYEFKNFMHSMFSEIHREFLNGNFRPDRVRGLTREESYPDAFRSNFKPNFDTVEFEEFVKKSKEPSEMQKLREALRPKIGKGKKAKWG